MTSASSGPIEISLERIDEVTWRIPASGPMRVDGIIFATDALIDAIRLDQGPRQVAAVATLPGIVGASLAMPDIHWGYGFPIGGVAAFDERTGVVSPGGVGYDINCGVRMHVLDVDAAVAARLAPRLADALLDEVPAGVGSSSRDIRLEGDEMDEVLTLGAASAVRMGFGDASELERLESRGCIPGAIGAAVSQKARDRGASQLGTLGSGNHFVEIDRIESILDAPAAGAYGLREGACVLTVHTGSRGLGHQVCDDFIRVMLDASRRHGIELVDRQLCCAPLGSPEADEYLAAMAGAANFAFANRHIVVHRSLDAVRRVLGAAGVACEHHVLYDVAHNIAKLEEHSTPAGRRRLLVHRKGATRALPPGHQDLLVAYRAAGQPVLIPGDMGRCSYVMAGEPGAALRTFASACHGAGRLLSRTEATRRTRAGHVQKDLESRGIEVRATCKATYVEEFPGAYKDVVQVVEAVTRAGLARPVARLVPLVVLKG